jgi:hypothetical protein
VNDCDKEKNERMNVYNIKNDEVCFEKERDIPLDWHNQETGERQI